MKRISLLIKIVAGFAASSVGASLAQAAIAPNPGGAIVVTNSTTSTFVTVDTPVTARVDEYSTTIEAILNGSQTIFSQTFSAPYADPSVQAAILQAEALFTADSATFTSPLLSFNFTTLLSSVVTIVPTGPAVLDGQQSSLVTTTFGPATIMVGENQSDSFFVLAGQSDININTNNEYAIPENVVTTNTFLTTQSYRISGNTVVIPPGPGAVPEPSTYGVAAFVVLGTVILYRRRARARSSV